MSAATVQTHERLYLVEAVFEPPSLPSARQFQALFERLDEAAVRAAMAVLHPDVPADDARAVASARRTVRFELLKDPMWARVEGISFESPPSIRQITRGLRRAAAVAAATAVVFGGTAEAINQAGRAVNEAAQLVKEVEELWDTLEQFGSHDPDDRESRVILRGRESEPVFELSHITIDAPRP